MADLNPRDRLQPFLLDRLTDDEPAQTKESREKYVFSSRQLKEAILRDLTWLLNTPAPTDDEGLNDFEHVAGSVLNFGITNLAGSTASGMAGSELARSVTKAIQEFEPRLDRHGLRVKVLNAEEGQMANTVMLEIKADMVASQVPDPLYIKTGLDLESGQFILKDGPNG
jgi:type VI secretion system protein ImpF